MEYVELACTPIEGEHNSFELLTAILGELGFESFVEEDDKLLAYIPQTQFDESLLQSELLTSTCNFSYSWSVIPDRNWNAVWEENFEPVTIEGKCHIRAPFHPSNPDIEYEIIIEPKMSFGTAHHETTAMMIKYLLELNFRNKKVLDMGSGTGVLAILAAMRGSTDITAIDIDEWAYNNAIENIQRNNTEYISVLLGDASLLKDQEFNVIIANINRNILLNDIPVYAECLSGNGQLLLSGFYIEDLDAIKACAGSEGLVFISHKEQNRWVAACFEKRAG